MGFMKEKKDNIRKNFLGTIIVIVALVSIVLILVSFLKLIKEPTQTFLIKKDILSDEEIVEALILREEVVITDNSNRLLQQDRFEGEKVSKEQKFLDISLHRRVKKLIE